MGGFCNQPQGDKFLADAEVLEEALHKEPDNARYAFYLAQSLRDAGEKPAALAAYRRRVAMGGWPEELWYSLFQVAALLEHTQAADAQIINAYLTAFEARPTRAEPLCELARMLRLRERYANAYVHARAAAEISLPDDLLFLNTSVYRWRARDEQAVAAYYSGRQAECGRICRALLADPHLPASERERVAANTRFG